LTGFAHHVFRMQPLPEEVASWMLDQCRRTAGSGRLFANGLAVCYDTHEVLLVKYLEILEVRQQFGVSAWIAVH